MAVKWSHKRIDDNRHRRRMHIFLQYDFQLLRKNHGLLARRDDIADQRYRYPSIRPHRDPTTEVGRLVNKHA